MTVEQTTTVYTSYDESMKINEVRKMLSTLKVYFTDSEIVSSETGQCFTQCIGECIDLLDALSNNAITLQ